MKNIDDKIYFDRFVRLFLSDKTEKTRCDRVDMTKTLKS